MWHNLCSFSSKNCKSLGTDAKQESLLHSHHSSSFQFKSGVCADHSSLSTPNLGKPCLHAARLWCWSMFRLLRLQYKKYICSTQRHSRKLCQSNFVVAVWGRSTYGCKCQVFNNSISDFDTFPVVIKRKNTPRQHSLYSRLFTTHSLSLYLPKEWDIMTALNMCTVLQSASATYNVILIDQLTETERVHKIGPLTEQQENWASLFFLPLHVTIILWCSTNILFLLSCLLTLVKELPLNMPELLIVHVCTNPPFQFAATACFVFFFLLLILFVFTSFCFSILTLLSPHFICV